MNRRDFLKTGIKSAPAIFAGAALVSCLNPKVEPDGELFSEIPFTYLIFNDVTNSFVLYGEQELKRYEFRYVAVEASPFGGLYDTMNVDIRTSASSSNSYNTINEDNVDDRIMRFPVNLQADMQRGPCLFELDGTTYAGFKGNHVVDARLADPVYVNDFQQNIDFQRRQVSDLKITGNFAVNNIEIGTAFINQFGRKERTRDGVRMCL